MIYFNITLKSAYKSCYSGGICNKYRNPGTVIDNLFDRLNQNRLNLNMLNMFNMLNSTYEAVLY